MRTRSQWIIISSATLLFFAIAAQRVEATDDQDKNALSQKALARYKAGDVNEDLLVPTSPAFAILGVTPQDVIRPDSPKALAMALLNGVDSKGNLQSGIALDFAPFYLFEGRSLSLEEYRLDDTDGYIKRLAYRLQTSIATTKGGSEDDKSVRMGLGGRVALWDEGDPRMSKDLDRCYDEVAVEKKSDPALFEALKAMEVSVGVVHQRMAIVDVKLAQPNLAKEDEAALAGQKKELEAQEKLLETQKKVAIEEAKAALKAVWSRCNEEFEKKNWNASNFTVGGAWALLGEEGDVQHIAGNGGAGYVSLAYGFGEIGWLSFKGVPWLRENSQLVLHARYRSNEPVADPDQKESFFQQDVTVLGGQIRIAGPDFGSKSGGRDLGFFGEIDYRRENRDARPDANVTRWVVGAEYKVVENTTISLNFGDDSGDRTNTSGTFAIGDVKWSF